MHTTGHCNSLSDLWSRLDMATLFPSHTDFHVVFFTVTAKNKQKTSLRYDIIKRNRVWSDVQTGNNLEPVVCMVSNRCQAPAVSLKYLNYPLWIFCGAPGHQVWEPHTQGLSVLPDNQGDVKKSCCSQLCCPLHISHRLFSNILLIQPWIRKTFAINTTYKFLFHSFKFCKML